MADHRSPDHKIRSLSGDIVGDENAPLLYTFLPRSKRTVSGTYGSLSTSSHSPTVLQASGPTLESGKYRGVWQRWTEGMGISLEYDWSWSCTSGKSTSRGLGGSGGTSGRTISRGREDIPPNALVLPLLIITLSCALADSGTLVAFQTFATSMTGNTVFLTISAFDLSPKSPIYAAVSLLTFIVAGLVSGQLGGILGHRCRAWLLSSIVFQTLVLLLATWSISPIGPNMTQHGRKWDWIYLFLIGLQGGPQVVMATNAGVRELPTAMMTTPYAAFISDPSLFSFASGDIDQKDTIARNRRAAYIVIFWSGAFVGAALMKLSSLWVLTLVVACLKVLAGMVVWGSRGEEVEEMEEESVDDSALLESEYTCITHHKRASSVFDTLSRQRPRDEHNVAM